MGSSAPTNDAVDLFQGTTGVDFERAIKILKYHGNDVQVALNDYFDNGDSNKYDQAPPSSQNPAWEELAFNSNGDGTSNNASISFRIDASDDLPTYGPNQQWHGAPSRPPSRTSNNRSPGKVIDLSNEAEKADPSTSSYRNMPQDHDIDQAIFNSWQDKTPQQSGITNTSLQTFGPATRDQYEQGKWDLVPTSKSYAREILMDPEPGDRKRDPSVPAFLKPTSEFYRLAALLTIYHEIPLIRELLIDRSNVTQNYGNHGEWWTGSVIQPAPVNRGEDEEDEIVDSEAAEFVKELQRLMAFLDKTDRSYGSVNALANSNIVKKRMRFNVEPESAVLEAYKSVFKNNPAKLGKIFSRGVEGPEETIDHEFAILELALPSKNSLSETLYDIADDALWNTAPFDLSGSPYLSSIGEIVSFRLEHWDDSKKRGVKVPATWYPDRYLKSGRQAALDMRLQKQNLLQEMDRICSLESGLINYDTMSGRRVTVQALLNASLQHDVDELEEVDNNPEEELMSKQRSAKNKKLSNKLRQLSESIDRKLIAYGEEKEKTKEALRELSRLYTRQLDDPNEPTLHRYTLRGVNTSESTTYICRQAEPDLIDMDIGSEDATKMGDQWWKITYSLSESKPVQVQQTTEEEVLEAASTSPAAMLVYASDKAMTWVTKALPIPLETFVRKDNALFKSEFPSSSSPVSSPKSPKRKSNGSISSDELEGGRYKSSVKVSEREVEDTDFEGAQAAASSLAQSLAQNGNGNEMIMGIDPNSDISLGQEMQERSGMRMLSARPMDGAQKPIDIMDMDQVMEDDVVAQESGAVKHVGFLD